MSKLRRRGLSPALVVSVITFVVVLGGTGYAAYTVGTSQIKNGAVTAPKLARNAVITSKIADRSVSPPKLAALEAPHKVSFELGGNPTGWRNCSSGYPNASFYKDSDGIVHLQGCVTGGGNSFMFSLPKGYRPPAFELFAVACRGCTADNVGPLVINPNGLVSVDTGGTYHLDGVTFRPAG